MNQDTQTTPAGGRYLLAADIGGTNARFVAVPSVVAAGTAKPEDVRRLSLATADFRDTAALIDEVVVRFGSDLKFAGCTLAIAGPVAGGRGTLTNGRLRFDDQQLSDKLSCPAVVVNDFFAVAASISDETPLQVVGDQATLTQDPLTQDPFTQDTGKPKSATQTRVRAVLGPGTGLGMGFLTLTPQSPTDRWQVFPSEGGNADFAPVDALELELLGIVQRTQSTVSIESLVSGRGLPVLYRALCELWGATPEHTTAAAISDAGVSLADPVSHKTLELFCAMLGTAAGNFALTVGARDGVFLAGGILPRIREFFCASEFRRRFDDRGPLSEFNQQIATYLVLDPEPGLTGAIREARNLVRSL